MDEETIDFGSATIVPIKHIPGQKRRISGIFIDRDFTYTNNKAEGEKFGFTADKFKEMAMQDNSINAVVIKDKVYFQICNGRSGDMFQGKENSVNKSKKEKLPRLVDLLLQYDMLFVHYKLNHVRDHEGSPFYELIGVGDKLTARLEVKEKPADDSGSPATTPQPATNAELQVDAIADEDLKEEENTDIAPAEKEESLETEI